jgi:hypothetical protein
MVEPVTRTDLLPTRQQLEAALEHQTLRLTVRLGGIVAIGVAVLATIIKLCRPRLPIRRRLHEPPLGAAFLLRLIRG